MFRDMRIVHRLYGRGRVERLELGGRQLFVRFDGEPCDRRVLTRDCEREPERMPSPAFDPFTPAAVYGVFSAANMR